MKVSFFHLMPYQDLPSDFEDRFHSAWVDLPNENFDPEVTQQYYDDYIDELRYADASGFDGICVNEHHNNAYGLMPSPNLIASVLANTTSQAALIVLGNSLALYQPPVRVAEEMAMLDIMSKGRLVAGVPGGHFNGHHLFLRPDSHNPPGQAHRGPRRYHAGLAGAQALLFQW